MEAANIADHNGKVATVSIPLFHHVLEYHGLRYLQPVKQMDLRAIVFQHVDLQLLQTVFLCERDQLSDDQDIQSDIAMCSGNHKTDEPRVLPPGKPADTSSFADQRDSFCSLGVSAITTGRRTTWREHWPEPRISLGRSC